VAEVEEVLGALRQTLPPLGLELNLRKTTVWGPRLVPASSPLTAAATPSSGGGHGGAGGTDPLPPQPRAGGDPPGNAKGKLARTSAAVVALAYTQCAHALIRSCLGPAKVEYALRTLPLLHTAVFAEDVTATQRDTWEAVVGTPTSDAA